MLCLHCVGLIFIGGATHVALLSRPVCLLGYVLLAASQNYELRHRIHTRSLPDRAGHLLDANFISRTIYKGKY